MIRTMIVDDEPLARKGIRARLDAESDVEIVGEAADGSTAVKMIKSLKPDLVLLDIQMPRYDGLAVLENVGGEHLPLVIFVTAYDVYAVRAFEAHALDYLLKPFSSKRFAEVLQRARRELGREDALMRVHSQVAELLDRERVTPDLPDGATPADLPSPWAARLVVKDGNRFVFVKVDNVNWIESGGNYVQLHTRAGSFVFRKTLTELERTLNPKRFARIHRTTIVNIDQVLDVKASEHGDFEVRLHNNVTLRLSRAYRERLLSGRST